MLYLIGLGLYDEKDLSLRGLEILKKCTEVYLENYTSRINFDVNNLEKLIGKKVRLIGREMAENKMNELIDNAKDRNIALLVTGDPLSATTHIAIMLEARQKNIDVKVVHNASIVDAVTETGLNIYNFGKIVSIPFDNKSIKSPAEMAKKNKRLGMHTLFLLDIKDGRCMDVRDALSYLINNGIKDELMIICCGLGREQQEIKAGKAIRLMKEEFTQEPACLILPGKLHFIEEEALKQWMIKGD